MKNIGYYLCTLLFIILFSLPLKLFGQEEQILKDNQMRIGFGIGYGKTVIVNGESNLQTLIHPLNFSNLSLYPKSSNSISISI